MSILPILPGTNFSEALAISETQPPMIAGYAQDGVTGIPWWAVLWVDGKPMALNLPVGPYAVANAVNDSGQVTGWMGESPTWRAFLWHEGSTVALGLLPNGTSTTGTGINNLGDVCGWGVVMTGSLPPFEFVHRAFIYRDGRMTDIGTLPLYASAYAFDINDAGEVVGECDDDLPGAGSPAFIWQNGVMKPVYDLLPPGHNLLMFFGANAINNKGQIAGWSVTQAPDLDPIAYILSPPQRIPGDCNCDNAINFDDILDIIFAWGPATPWPGNRCDLNRDGQIDLQDIMIVLQSWK